MNGFEVWMARVDAVLEKRLGVDSRDLPDQPYRPMFEAGETPASAAREALDEAGWCDETELR